MLSLLIKCTELKRKMDLSYQCDEITFLLLFRIITHKDR